MYNCRIIVHCMQHKKWMGYLISVWDERRPPTDSMWKIEENFLVATCFECFLVCRYFLSRERESWSSSWGSSVMRDGFNYEILVKQRNGTQLCSLFCHRLCSDLTSEASGIVGYCCREASSLLHGNMAWRQSRVTFIYLIQKMLSLLFNRRVSSRLCINNRGEQ